MEEGSSPTLEGEGEWGEEEDGDGSSHSTVVEDSVSLHIYYLYYRNILIDRLQLLNYRKLAFTFSVAFKFPCSRSRSLFFIYFFFVHFLLVLLFLRPWSSSGGFFFLFFFS